MCHRVRAHGLKCEDSQNIPWEGKSPAMLPTSVGVYRPSIFPDQLPFGLSRRGSVSLPMALALLDSLSGFVSSHEDECLVCMSLNLLW